MTTRRRRTREIDDDDEEEEEEDDDDDDNEGIDDDGDDDVGDGDGVGEVTTERAVMRRDAIAATRGDAICAVRALVSASETVAIGEGLLGRGAARGARRGEGAVARSGAGECSIGAHPRSVKSIAVCDDADDECRSEDDAREEMVTEACAHVKRARGALGLDVFDFETTAHAATTPDIVLSDDDLDDILAQVEYSSNGWETHAERSATAETSVGCARTAASAAPVAGTQSQLLFSQLIVESQVVDGRDQSDSDDDGHDDADTASEEDNHAGGTQMMFSDFEDDDDAPGATQCAEDIDAEFAGGTQVFNEEDSDHAIDAMRRDGDDTQTPPSKRGTPSFLRINSGSLALPQRASGAKRIESQAKNAADKESMHSPARPMSLWAAASCTPAEETARRESAAQTLAGNASIPPNLAHLGTEPQPSGTEPQRVANTQLTTDVANDSGIIEPCSNVEYTPLEAMEQAREPPTLKRPRVLQKLTQDSMVTASAQALGSIDTEDRDGGGGVQRVARTAIEAIQRSRAKANEPLGLDMSMPQDLMDSQAIEDEDKNDRIKDDVLLGQPVEDTNDDHNDDDDFDNAGGDDFGPDTVGETPPSSPDIGFLYSQCPAEDVASPGRPQTQLSQSPMKPSVAPPPMGPPLSQAEVESPVSRIMMSQHQWRQKKHRRSIPPPPRFDEETPTRRVRIIDDDLTQPTQTQPTQDSFGEHSDGDGDFIEQTQDEGGLLRPILPHCMPDSFIKPGARAAAPVDDHQSPTTSSDARQKLPSLGCSKCRYSKGGCGRCRLILENAKKGIFPPGRGRRASTSSTPLSRTNTKRLSPVAKTPASKTPTSKRAVSRESCRLRAPKFTSEKKSVKEQATGRVTRFFADAYFLLSGLGKSASSLKDAIRTHGGTVLDSPSTDVPVNAVFIITPTLGRTMKCLYGFSAGVKFATPDWIEACVDANTMIDITEPLDADGQPRKRHRATNGRLFRGIKTALTGNEGFVKDFASLLAYAGAELESNPQTTVKFDYLIVQSGEKPHSAWVRASKRLNIPCVRHEWLVESILAGELLTPEPFIYLDATPAAYVPLRESIDSELSGHRRKSTRY